MFSSTNGLSIEVIDPCNRTGKITIPLMYVSETLGLAETRTTGDTHPKDLSLCLLFQRGRCNAAARCHQIHAQPAFVEKLRAQAAACRRCCALHGDLNSTGFSQSLRRVVVTNGPTSDAQTYNLSAFARTAALDAVLRTNDEAAQLRVPRNKVCRLHLENRCKFGRDCKNYHLCADAVPSAPLPAPEPLRKDLGSFRSASVSTCGISCAGTPTKSSLSGTPDRSPSEPKLPTPKHSVTPIPMSWEAFLERPIVSAPLSSPTSITVDGFEQTISLVLNDLFNVVSSPVLSP